MPTQIKLGLSMRYLGYHAAAWRHPDVDPNGASKPALHPRGPDRRGREVRHGLLSRRHRHDQTMVMPGITRFIGRTRQEAQDEYEQLNALVDPTLGLSCLYGQMGDISAHDLDGPVPEPADPAVRTVAKSLLAMSRRDNLTIRQLYTKVAARFGSRLVIGTAADVVDDMQEWPDAGAADGLNVCPPLLPTGLDDFAAMVIPELRRRGLFRTKYESTTLRGNLGLAEPRNHYDERP